jgi:cell division transport system permease protein
MAVTLFLTLVGLVVREAASSVSEHLAANVRIAAILRHDLSGDEQVALLHSLRTVRGIQAILPPSNEDLLEASQLKAISANTGGTVVIVDPVDTESWQEIAVRVRDTAGVAGIEVLGSGTNRIAAAAELANVLLPPVPLILGAAALILLTINARLIIAARRAEVNTMRLVGAANWFIRLPFILEGVILGLAGGILAIAWVWIIWSVTRESIAIGDAAASTLTGTLLRWSLAGAGASALVGALTFYASFRMAETGELRASARRQVSEIPQHLSCS